MFTREELGHFMVCFFILETCLVLLLIGGAELYINFYEVEMTNLMRAIEITIAFSIASMSAFFLCLFQLPKVTRLLQTVYLLEKDDDDY